MRVKPVLPNAASTTTSIARSVRKPVENVQKSAARWLLKYLMDLAANVATITRWQVSCGTVQNLIMATATKRAAPKKAAARKATSKKAAPKKKSALKKATPRRTAAKKAAPKRATAKKAATKRVAPKKKSAPAKKNKLGVKNSLVNNINAKKKSGTSQSKKKSSVSKKAYKNMENNWGRK
jgi:hypothetical protein